MPSSLILEFDGVTTDQYDAVNAALGLDGPDAEWPDGLFSHAAGINDGGNLVVMEVWDTPAHQARFMETRLGEAIGKAGITSPPDVTWIELHRHESFV